jgi:hypothetical protein
MRAGKLGVGMSFLMAKLISSALAMVDFEDTSGDINEDELTAKKFFICLVELVATTHHISGLSNHVLIPRISVQY